MMSNNNHQPFTSRKSILTPAKIAGLLEISETGWSRQGQLLWRERSSSRSAVLSCPLDGGIPQNLSGALQIGGKLLYGGGSYCAVDQGVLVVDRDSGQLIRASGDGEPYPPVTTSLVRAASPTLSPDGSQAIVVHSDGEEDALYLIDLNGGKPPATLDRKADFYNYPCWHPDGTRLAWMSWNHPYMPWDSSTIWMGVLDSSSGKASRLSARQLVSGGEGISVLQPEFSPDGKWLSYISDQSGWWQLYLFDLKGQKHIRLTDAPAEHALPPWLQSRKSYGFSPDSQKIFFLRNQQGHRTLWSLNINSREEAPIALTKDFTWMDWLSVSPREEQIAIVASAPDLPPQLVIVKPNGEIRVIQQSNPEPIPREIFSIPKPIHWPSKDGNTIQGLFYQPHQSDVLASDLPPLLLMIHSGPTRQKFAEFQARTQYFTSRGYAVLEANYRGSSGYGRAYRQSLVGEWGVADVDDCLSGALYVAGKGWVNRDRMFLMGSSSGGLTVFQILVKYPGIFRAGITLYAVVNHLDLLADAPKFERYYSDWLIGPYPDQEHLYRDRSPVFFAERIQDPIAVFQGGKDPIVPRDQAEQIIDQLDQNGVEYQYHFYPDEGHGFKRAENLADFYQKTELFLNQFQSDQ